MAGDQLQPLDLGRFGAVRMTIQAHDGGLDLGRRGESPRGQAHDHLRPSQRLGQDGEPPIGLRAAGGGDPVRHLLLEHQGHGGGLERSCEPVDEQGGGDVIGEVGDDPDGKAGRVLGHEGGLVHLHGVGANDDEPTFGDVDERPQQFDEAGIALHRHDLGDAFVQQRARQAAGAGPDLQHGRTLQRAGQAGDLAGEVQVEQEMLAEALVRRETVRGQALA